MTTPAKFQLSRLREIGWLLWDPIGLKSESNSEWQDGGGCADEYDGYLLEAANSLRRGEPVSAVISYLEQTETGDIGLTPNATTRSRAEATVAAIATYLSTLPDQQISQLDSRHGSRAIAGPGGKPAIPRL